MFRKYATATVISAEIARPNAGLIKNAHRAEFNYTPRPGFLYVRSRMISSRCNDNHDEFPAEEIRKAWKTAVGKPVFVNHHNEDHRRMRGVIIDAALHEDTLPDGRPDVWIEALHEIDAQRFPKLAQAIIEGRVNRTSMGTDVGYSICSACGNKATTPAEYCQHIPQMKGKILYRHTASGQREGHLIREICYKLGFFENSFLVEDPADPTAVVTGVDDRGLRATASLTNPEMLPGRRFHIHGAKSSLPKVAEYDVPCERPGCGTHWGPHGAAGLLIHHDDPEDGQTRYLLQKRAPWVDHGGTWGIPGGALHEGESPEEGARREAEEEMGELPDGLAHHRTHSDDHGGWTYHTVRMRADEPFHPGEWDDESTGHGWFTRAEMRNMDLHPGFAQSLPEVLGEHRKESSLPSIEIEAARYDKHQHPGLMRDEGNIHMRNPHRRPSSLPSLAFRKGAPFAGYEDFDDCVDRNADAEDPEAYCGEIQKRTEGRRSSLPRVAVSYKEMHKQADYRGTLYHGTDAAGARGIMRNGLQEKSYLTPDADGARMFAQSTAGCYDWADENDDHPDECPHEDHEPPVVLAIHGIEGEGLKKDYPEVTAENLGHHTYVDAGDYVMNYHRVPSERITRHSSLPSVLAYGETKAPQDVDTLRTESCPVCGEVDAFDGDRCQVCNFLQPPSMFTDPDTGVARQMELRKDEIGQQAQVGPDGQPIPGQEGTDPNDPLGQDPAMQGLPGQAEDGVADLFCPACGFSADTQAPMTNNDPSMPSGQQGLLAGDVCPNCGEATMLSPNDVGMLGGEVPQEIADDANANGVPDDQEGEMPVDEGDLDGDGVPDDVEEGELDEEADAEAEADAVEDEDEAPKGRKDNTRRAARRG